MSLVSGKEVRVNGAAIKTAEDASKRVEELTGIVDSAQSWIEIGDGQIRARPETIIAVSFEEQSKGWATS